MTALEREIDDVATYAAAATTTPPDDGWNSPEAEASAAVRSWLGMPLTERYRWVECTRAVLGMEHDADAVDWAMTTLDTAEASAFRQEVLKTRVATPCLTEWLRLNGVKLQLRAAIKTVEDMQRDVALKR